ncbi:hypothetical protein STURON_00844 [Spiroplasma turonicum]|uniref:Uncharacterized protein n=2 Tax=Spiroplasma turonicum TaxID=216946 RepID=A0A0K1P732_9MOLU|nr:hypothetical protein STURON_00844 [Spiroplasma turonicum]
MLSSMFLFTLIGISSFSSISCDPKPKLNQTPIYLEMIPFNDVKTGTLKSSFEEKVNSFLITYFKYFNYETPYLQIDYEFIYKEGSLDEKNNIVKNAVIKIASIITSYKLLGEYTFSIIEKEF